MITWNLRLHIVKRIAATEPENSIGWAHLFDLKSEALPRVGEVVSLDRETFGPVCELLHLELVDQSQVTNVEHSVSAAEDRGSVMLTVRTTSRYGGSNWRLSQLPHWTSATD
ncbi:hypothetical protein ACMT9Y_15335 [Clavibacter tessellarius]|uniref:hypothetical protein n=1 Tax=Clavibacter tessellarius TaxID=31965 RepID=UPI0039EBFBE6